MTNPPPKPSQKPKRKRKRKNDEGGIPLWMIVSASLVVLIIVGAGAFLLIRSREPSLPDCPDPSVPCVPATPTMIPNVLYPTVTPAGMLPGSQNQIELSTMALSPDSSQLVAALAPTAAEDPSGVIRSFRLINDPSGQQDLAPGDMRLDLAPLPMGQVDTIAFDPLGRHVALASKAYHRTMLYPADFSQIVDGSDVAVYRQYTQVAFSPDGRYYAIANEDDVQLYDAETLELLDEADFIAQPEAVDITFDSTSGLLAVARSQPGAAYSPYVRVWDVSSGSLEEYGPTIKITDTYIMDIAFNPVRNQIAMLNLGELMVADLDTGETHTYVLMGHASRALAYSPQGDMLAWGTERGPTSGDIYLLPLEAGIPLRNAEDDTPVTIVKMPTSPGVHTLAWSPEGTLIAGLANGRIELYDAHIGQVIASDAFYP